ncbi:phage holin family protein [Streptomyces daliensis]
MTDVAQQTGKRHVDGQTPVSTLVSRASAQLSQLVRDEMRLAWVELSVKGRSAGRGGGLYGAAGLLGLLAAMAGVATGIAGPAEVWPVWLSALVVTGVLLALAGVLALMGRAQLRKAAPPVPRQAIEGVQADIETIRTKGRTRR